MRCLRLTSGVVLLTIAAASGAAAQEPLRADALARALGASSHAAAAEAFYDARGHRAMWTRAAALSAHGRALVAALAEADADGLDPADYPASLSAAPEASEAALTTAFLRFCEHLMRGRVAPEAVHRDWRASRRRLDAGAALRLAAERGPLAAIRSARPPHAGYAQLRGALSTLRAVGGTPWEPLASGPVLREGDDGPRVAALRQRLVALGALSARSDAPWTPSSQPFDAEIDTAVRTAQARFGLSIDGIVGPATRAALNVTPEARVRQVALNMERWRWLPAALGERHIWIDASGMTVALVEGNSQPWSGRAIVGTPRTPTPGFSSEITHAVLSPYWNVPASIASAEIWPLVRRDPGYLARHHMERLPGGALRQRPGPDNPLGPVKFIFENPFGVRLHGTSNPALFERAARAFSHGCMRAERPLALAERLLQGWDTERIETVVASREETWVALDAPLPIHVTYWSARADARGQISYSPDVYGRDRALAAALARR